MRFKLFKGNFDLTCESHQNTSKTYILWTFLGVLKIIKCCLKIDFIMSEPHYVKFLFLQTSSIVQLFDFLTSDK